MPFDGTKLRELRIQRGLSHADLALSSGVDSGLIRGAEAGKSVPREPSLQRLARALGCTVEDLHSSAPRRTRDAVDDPPPTRFDGAKLRALRHRRGWSQSDLAERAQLNPRMIRFAELGQSSPRGYCQRQLASALGCAVEELHTERYVSTRPDALVDGLCVSAEDALWIASCGTDEL